MATAPTSKRLNLTRDQLAQFLTDQQQIRQFELLFAAVDELQVIVGTDFEYQADTAAATANEALAQLSALAQDTAVDQAVLNAKVQQALDAVSQFARTLELIATAPAIQNNNSVATDYIDFNTTTPSPVAKVGRLHWNGGYTLNLEMTANVNQAIGESQYYYIKASAAIAKGQLVMFDGSVGASGVLKGKPSTGVTNGQLIMGVAAEAIANNGFGLVSSFGLVRGFNTTGTPYGEVWADGDILYYNPSFAGGLTKTQPTAPLPHIVVAAVVNAATAGSGSVFVRVQAEPLINQLSDVYAPTPANNDVLIYDAVQQRWENAPISSAGSVTSVTGTSPVVSSGGTTPAISLASGYGDTQNPYASKTANYFLAAPNGSAGAPTFRAIVAADIPALPYGTGTVTSVSVVSANGFAGTVATSTTTPAITMSTSISGLLYGNGTALAATTVSAPLAYSAGTLSITQSGAASNGYLSSTDWNTFNNKQPAGTYVTSVTGTAPVVSSGGTTPAISMAAANTSTNGYLTSTDWNTFNNKGSGTVTSVAALTLGTTGTDLSSTVANGTTTPVITLNVPTASASNRGALSSTDWSTFNGKQAALVSGTNIKTVNGTTLLGSGDLGTITVPYGGTGLTSLTSGYIPYGNGTGAYSSSSLLQFDGTRLKIGGNAGDSAGLDVIRGGGTNYIAKFRTTSASTPYGVAIEEPSGAAAGYPTLIVYSFAGATTWFRIDSGGGTYFSNVTTTASAANAYIDTASGYQLKRSTSSARFKRDIENIDSDVSANIFKLRPIWYRSKANDDNQAWSWYGLLAEEVAEVEPRLVQWGYAPEDYNTEYDVSKTTEEDENGDLVEREVKHPKQVLKPGATMRPDGVMYDRLSVMLLAEMKKLRQEFDEYRASHP